MSASSSSINQYQIVARLNNDLKNKIGFTTFFAGYFPTVSFLFN